MIKDIIVNLSVTKNGGVVGNYAASVAAALQTQLTGVAFIYDPIVQRAFAAARICARWRHPFNVSVDDCASIALPLESTKTEMATFIV
jgi:hypothetical protein